MELCWIAGGELWGVCVVGAVCFLVGRGDMVRAWWVMRQGHRGASQGRVLVGSWQDGCTCRGIGAIDVGASKGL